MMKGWGIILDVVVGNVFLKGWYLSIDLNKMEEGVKKEFE